MIRKTTFILFPDAPDVDPISDTMYKLRRAFRYQTLTGLVIDVPLGFKTDLLSAPRITWTLLGLPPDGLYRSAAVVHDWLYEKQGAIGLKALTRRQCDDILMEAMIRVRGDDGSGINRVQRILTFWAVRVFGGRHWRS